MRKRINEIKGELSTFLFHRSREIKEEKLKAEAKLKLIFHDGIIDLCAIQNNQAYLGLLGRWEAWVDLENDLEKEIRSCKIKYFFTICAAVLFALIMAVIVILVVAIILSITAKLLPGLWFIVFQ